MTTPAVLESLRFSTTILCTRHPAHFFQPSHHSLFIVNNAIHIVPVTLVRAFRETQTFRRSHEAAVGSCIRCEAGWERRAAICERMSSQCGAETGAV